MSIPAALTAILTIEPAYGLQLHAELASRLPHRISTNVGQIYSTLERLMRDRLVERQGETDDGLPLYIATPLGRDSSTNWLAATSITTDAAWAEIMDVLLLGASIPGSPIAQACDRVTTLFSEELTDGTLAGRASAHYAQAVRLTATDIVAAINAGTLPTRGFALERPTRGRKPRTEI